MKQDECTVTVSGEKVSMSLIEYRILKVLMGQPLKTFAREELSDLIWKTDRSEAKIGPSISKLRGRLGCSGGMIKCVRMKGYYLE